MSYCRCNGLSDVYIFGSQDHLECHVAWEPARQAMIEPTYTVPYGTGDGTAEKAMLGHCQWLLDNGIRVPGYAIRRLISEIGEFEDRRYLDALTAAESLQLSQRSSRALRSIWTSSGGRP